MPYLDQEPTAVSDKIISMRLPLKKNVFFAKVVSTYVPTLTNPEENKEEFYRTLRKSVKYVSITDKLIIAGGFNARIAVKLKIGQALLVLKELKNCNSNGELLLTFCSEHQLVITNTIFKHKQQYKTTWMHPRSQPWHLLYYVSTRQKDMSEVLNTRAMRGADYSTDHILVRSKLAFMRIKSRQKETQRTS